MRDINWRLGALQISSIVLAALLTLTLVVLYHHFTEDYFTPLPNYLGSIKLAAPPLLILFASYFMTFLLGEKVRDAPRIALHYLRNSFLQDPRKMKIFLISGIVAILISTYVMRTVTPPHYETLVAVLLGGEQDRQELIKKRIKSISEKNEDLAKQLQLVVDVFELRSKWNFLNKEPNTTEPRIFVRALEANIPSPEWRQHPLRKHALAEAYSMWAQAAKASSYAIDSKDWEEWLRKSVSIYAEVIHSGSILATPLMKFSAIQNTGNAYLYTGDMANSVRYYDRALSLNENLSTAGNMIAALVLQEKYDEAIDLGSKYIMLGEESGMAATEGSSFSGVVGSTAFAHLAKGQFNEGTRLMQEAYNLESDELNTLNFAAALALLGKSADALDRIRRHFKYPPLDPKDQAKRVTEQYNACYYVVSSVIETEASNAVKAARLYTYLGEARTRAQLESETRASLGLLNTKVESALEKRGEPCASLLLIPKFKRLLRSAYYRE